MLVEGDVDALTTATNRNTRIALSLLNRQCTRMGKVGIVATVLVVGAKVFIGNALLVKTTLDGFLGRIAGVVTAKCHGHTWFQN